MIDALDGKEGNLSTAYGIMWQTKKIEGLEANVMEVEGEGDTPERFNQYLNTFKSDPLKIQRLKSQRKKVAVEELSRLSYLVSDVVVLVCGSSREGEMEKIPKCEAFVSLKNKPCLLIVQNKTPPEEKVESYEEYYRKRSKLLTRKLIARNFRNGEKLCKLYFHVCVVEVPPKSFGKDSFSQATKLMAEKLVQLSSSRLLGRERMSSYNWACVLSLLLDSFYSQSKVDLPLLLQVALRDEKISQLKFADKSSSPRNKLLSFVFFAFFLILLFLVILSFYLMQIYSK